MSKHKKTGTHGSTASRQGFAKESTALGGSAHPQQKLTVSVAATPLVSLSTDQVATNVTFTAVMAHLQMAAFEEVINEGVKQIEHNISQIHELTPEIEKISINNPAKIIEYIDLLIRIKELVARLLSWMSVVASIEHYFVITLNEQLPDELINSIETSLTVFEEAFDAALTNIPCVSILGISLAPDQKQVSETKAVISDVFSRIEKIKRENKEANQDWGSVEQNAYARILEGSHKNVSGEEFLSWLSELEQGGDV